MILYLTKKLSDKLKIFPVAETASDDFFTWQANYVQEHGQRFLVFMNDATRFTVVINEAKAAKLKKTSEIFIQTLRNILLALCVNPEVIDLYIADLGDIVFSKNNDRKKIAWLNKSVDNTWYALNYSKDDVELSIKSSKVRIYNNTSNYDVNDSFKPTQKMLELLKRYNLPIRKFTALDLNARLALDGKHAVRKLRVPANITFEILHKILQKAFGWKNCHLHSFGLFREWSENYYARPDVELVTVVDEYATDIDPQAKNIEGVRLCDYIPEYKKILYCYDFGDDWHHYIEVENVIENCEEEVPVLLSGENDAPPEDVGGSGGFEEFLEAIAVPNHEDYEHMTSWAKSQRWERFDFKEVEKDVKNLL